MGKKPAKPKKPPKPKPGPPPVHITWSLVEGLCRIQCTGEEIASVLKVNYDTLAAAVKREHGQTFDEYRKEQARPGLVSLRRLQFKQAEESVPMSIHLGKQYLGQAEKIEATNKRMPAVADAKKRAAIQKTLDEARKTLEQELEDHPDADIG